ncbi:MAG: carbon monoxide dehydrogenase [Methanoregulaceae archaeon]|nr:carbon monoxide dehydrogenase [Methanoregulaceae archaeon]
MTEKELHERAKATDSCGCPPGECCPAIRHEERSGHSLPEDRCSCKGPNLGNSTHKEPDVGIHLQDRADIPSIPAITPVSGTLDSGDMIDHILARLGQNRTGQRVTPGLYSIGCPGPGSPVIVTANYSLSFDAVRSSLESMDAYILVLDTKGINVWCAAGKGTFGTEELVKRIRSTGLTSVVNHHRIILPQLGAPGVAAHEVHKATGFHVEYGPVRASDLPEFLRNRVATPAMREVTFDLWERAVLIPVELRSVALYSVIAAIALWFIGGWLPAGCFIAALLAGTVLFPVFLPYLPTTDFSTKGLVLGIIVAAPFAAIGFLTIGEGTPLWVGIAAVIAILFTLPAITAYLALNFTGCTPYTSRTGVRKEIYQYIPFMAGFAVTGVISAMLTGFTRYLGMW